MAVKQFTYQDAYDTLGVDSDIYTTSVINALVDSIPSYIESTTGMTVEQQGQEPLIYTVSTFLIQLWYFPEGVDAYRLRQVIDSLLMTITLRVKDITQ